MSNTHHAHTKPKAGGGQKKAAEVAASGITSARLVIVLAMMVAVFLGAYNFASARTGTGTPGASSGADYYAPSASGGGGCCGGGGAPIEDAATLDGDVQRIAVDTSSGSFSPNVIRVKAGVPVEIDFSQSPGGCLSGVLFPDFNINEDLTQGGKTVQLPALEKGTYTFYCQMQMVSAQIVAE